MNRFRYFTAAGWICVQKPVRSVITDNISLHQDSSFNGMATGRMATLHSHIACRVLIVCQLELCWPNFADNFNVVNSNLHMFLILMHQNTKYHSPKLAPANKLWFQIQKKQKRCVPTSCVNCITLQLIALSCSNCEKQILGKRNRQKSGTITF